MEKYQLLQNCLNVLNRNENQYAFSPRTWWCPWPSGCQKIYRSAPEIQPLYYKCLDHTSHWLTYGYVSIMRQYAGQIQNHSSDSSPQRRSTIPYFAHITYVWMQQMHGGTWTTYTNRNILKVGYSDFPTWLIMFFFIMTVHTLSLEPNGRYFAGDILKCIFLG